MGPLAAILILLAVAQNPAPRVLSARQEAVYLGGQLAKKVMVIGSLQEEILSISNGSDPQHELSAVAKALHASVIESPGGVMIERTPADRKSEENGLLAWRKSWLERGLDFYRDARKKRLNEVSQSQAIIDALQAKRDKHEGVLGVSQVTPAGSLLEELVRRIGLEKVAAMPGGRSQVFETNPVLDAQPLPPVEDLTSAYQNQLKSLVGLSLDGSLLQQAEITSRALTALSDNHLPQPAIYRLSVASEDAEVDFRLEVYSQSSEKVDEAYLKLKPHLDGGPGSTWEPSGPPPLPLSEDALEMRLWVLNNPPKKPGDWITDPVAHDPLAPFAAPAIQAYTAANDGRLVVADVPDWVLEFAADYVGAKELNVEEFGRAMDERDDLEKLTTPDGDVWRPRNPEEVEASRAPRDRLRKLIDQARTARSIDTRMIAHFFEEAYPNVWAISPFWARACHDVFAPDQPYNEVSPATYNLIGAISDEDWQRLSNGASMTADSLGVTDRLEAVLREDQGMLTKGTAFETVVSDGMDYRSLFIHDQELYQNAPVGQSPIFLEVKSVPTISSYDAVAGKNEGWLLGGLIPFAFEGCMPHVDHPTQAQLDQLRPQFEETASRIQLLEGSWVQEALGIGVPRGFKLVKTLPTYVGDVHPLNYANLSQERRDAFWRGACQNLVQP